MKMPKMWRGLPRAGVAVAAAALALAGCSLDLENPNEPREEDVITSVDGLVAAAIGIQAQYAENINIWVRASALPTDEWGTRPLALATDESLVAGGPDPAFLSVFEPFAATYRTVRTANILIENTPRLPVDSILAAALISHAQLFKAMSLGQLVNLYERMPADTGAAALPLPREQVRDTVIDLLEEALAGIAPYTDAQLAVYRSRVQPTAADQQFDLRSTINAMLARWYLFDGRYTQAIDAAGRVDRTKLARLSYPNPGQNPIWAYASTNQYVGARKEFFTESGGDPRALVWARRTGGSVGRPDSVFPFNRYGARNDPYPLYLPDEMRLIQAEAHTRLGQFAEARDLINAVRRGPAQNADDPVAGYTADLPVTALDTEEELLAQIAFERRYELFAQGLRLEDMRRLDAYIDKEPSLDFLPYPQAECDRNPANPCD